MNHDFSILPLTGGEYDIFMGEKNALVDSLDGLTREDLQNLAELITSFLNRPVSAAYFHA